MPSATVARRLRVLALPVLLLGVATYAVHTAGQAPEPPPAVSVEPVPLPEPLGELWAAWGDDLGSRDGRYPVLLGALNRDEALYVLLSVRAAQVAEAVAQGGPQADVGEALEEAGLSPLSEVEAVLLRTARVGLLNTDASSCGGAVAYSPTAQQALEELSPELLS